MNEQVENHEADRVRRHTSPEVLDELDERISQNIRFYATQPDHVITARIEELDREWDMERWLGTNASSLALTGAVMGLVSGKKKWFLLTGGVLGFLLQHAVTGWCPPVPVFRRLGVRTRTEIDREKFALKALRGDFKDIPSPAPTRAASTPESIQALNA